MKKRIFAAAALMLCIASAALAGGKETVEYFRKPDGESVPDAYVYGEDMPGVYTYGGSRRDWVNSMAVAPDGRIAITGYTESSDGTLSDRTKTWRAGWVMMLDESMNVQWNFCSRSGDADHIRFPVFHEDGTMSAVHYTEGKQIKIIRLNAGGERIASKTVLTEYAQDENIYAVGVLDMGYLMERLRKNGSRATHQLYDWNGNLLAAYEGMTITDTVGGSHLLRRVKEGIELCALDARGNLTPLSLVAQAERDGVMRLYEDIITLEDGGAAACGRIWEKPITGTEGLLSRWDAQGNLVFEMIVPMGELKAMARTDRGFAAACVAYDDPTAAHRWKLLEFDEAGVICTKHELYEDKLLTQCALAQAADGALLCAQSVGEYAAEDVRVTIIEAK